jgi:probable HAF family extracellular repeat protein
MQDLGTLGGAYSEAAGFSFAINDRGQVVGTAATGTGSAHAFRWTPSVGMRDLGTLGDGSSGQDGQHRVGDQRAWPGGRVRRHAGRLEPCVPMDPVPRDAGPGHAGRHGERGDRHQQPRRGGRVFPPGRRPDASVPVDASRGIQDLGTLGGEGAVAIPGPVATGINDPGHVVGSAYTAAGEQHAYRWTPSGGMQDLGTLGGADSSASGINVWDQVTGTAATADADAHAFLWSP